MNFCKNCKHISISWDYGMNYFCEHPHVKVDTLRLDPVYGPMFSLVNCKNARYEGDEKIVRGLCGPDGDLYEPNLRTRIWYKLFGVKS